jgi:hypothetical protein
MNAAMEDVDRETGRRLRTRYLVMYKAIFGGPDDDGRSYDKVVKVPIGCIEIMTVVLQMTTMMSND